MTVRTQFTSRGFIKRHTVIAFCAALITATSYVASFAAMGFASPGRRLASYVAYLALPGFIVVLFAGAGDGAHGMPNEGDIEVWVITFAFWWALLHFGHRWLRSRQRLH